MVETAAAAFAELLKQYRAEAGLTQEELAERAGLSARAISNLERGVRHRPYPHTIQLLVQALGLENGEAARFRRAARSAEAGTDGARESAEHVAHSHSLPIQPTPFVGRQQELEEVRTLLGRVEVRLLTLTGPGGVGKTRLALRAAEESTARFRDGVVFIPLAPLTDPALVPAAIAGILEVKELNAQPLQETLVEQLRVKQLLLVLDNFEHLLEAAEMVSRLLATCPQLTILVTSRAILRLTAEYEYSVPPLAVPVPGHRPELLALSRLDAVQLFLQRAEAVRADFRMTEENAAAIAELCWRLDGLPLAIELAAARLRLFPPQALLPRLGARLQLLAGGPIDMPPRQRALRDTIEWSYRLLAPHEQRIFARLSVFRGGCTLEATEAVCNPEGGLDVVAGITTLVEQSLLQSEGEQEPRLRMLETVREYAAEQLEASGEGELIRRVHAAYFAELASRIEPDEARQPIAQVVEWLRVLDAEQDNLRGALRWLLSARDANGALELVGWLGQYWMFRGQLSEGRQWTEEALALEGERDPKRRAWALYSLHRFLRAQGDFIGADRVLRQCLALSENIGDTRGAGLATYSLGNVAAELGKSQDDRVFQERALALFQALGDELRVAEVKIALFVHVHGAGNSERAAAMAEEALDVLRRFGPTPSLARMLLDAGYGFLIMGRHQRAAPLFRESLWYHQQLGHPLEIIDCLDGLAVALALQGEAERACRLLGATTVARDALGAALMPADTPAREPGIRAARAQLGDASWERAWNEGRAMTLEEAVECVLTATQGVDGPQGIPVRVNANG